MVRDLKKKQIIVLSQKNVKKKFVQKYVLKLAQSVITQCGGSLCTI